MHAMTRNVPPHTAQCSPARFIRELNRIREHHSNPRPFLIFAMSPVLSSRRMSRPSNGAADDHEHAHLPHFHHHSGRPTGERRFQTGTAPPRRARHAFPNVFGERHSVLVTDMLATAMRICTWNVGGLKGEIERVVPWLRDNQPDIVGLQEARTRNPQSGVSTFQSEGYCCKLHMEPDDKGWVPGVGILSKHPLEVTQVGLPGQAHRGARLLTASTAGLSFTTVCVPAGSGRGQRRIERKLAWLDSLSEHLRGRKAEDVPAVLCGDFNITPKPIDNYHHWENTRERKDKPGFREDERSRICSLVKAGWSDLVRDLNPDERTFSWWWSRDYYNDDKGLWMDLVFGNAAVVKRLQFARIDRSHYADRGRTGKPDHAPVIVDLA